jgi:hypothetical protein
VQLRGSTNINHYTEWLSQRKRKAAEYVGLPALCGTKTQEWTAKINSRGCPARSTHKVDLQSCFSPQHNVYKQGKVCDIYFECVKDDIQFDGVLSADEVIYLACVGERDEDQDGYN